MDRVFNPYVYLAASVLTLTTVPSTYLDGYVRDYVMIFVLAVTFSHLAVSNLALPSQVLLHVSRCTLRRFLRGVGWLVLVFFGKLLGDSRVWYVLRRPPPLSLLGSGGTTTHSKVWVYFDDFIIIDPRLGGYMV